MGTVAAKPATVKSGFCLSSGAATPTDGPCWIRAARPITPAMNPRFCAGPLLVGAALLTWGCRIESAAPRAGTQQSCDATVPGGEVWIYTSAFPAVCDELEALAQKQLPQVKLRWFKAGSEKIASRLEGEFAAGGTQADLLMVSDPFYYKRLKDDGHFTRYASPFVLRVPPSLVDPDAAFATVRVSTMVLAFRGSLANPPHSFHELTDPRWKGAVAIGDPLSSGTAFTWAVFEESKEGKAYFRALRENGAVVAGGNAAVQAKIEGGEAKVGVLLLENVLAARAKGSDLSFRYPDDGAVAIPGFGALFHSSRNPIAAKAMYDLLLSPEGQSAMVQKGLLHAADPRQPGPAGEPGLTDLLAHTQPWTVEIWTHGLTDGARVKADFAEAFSR